MKNSAVTIRIPNDMKKELEDLAEEENISVSDLVRESLNHFLAVKRFRQIRSKVLPFAAESQGLLTDEEIFKTVS
ncbi:ribbon-helix-helix domain-containing protein [Bdellovibrionota bacterium FG-2]